MSKSGRSNKRTKDKKNVKEAVEDVVKTEKEGALAFKILSEDQTKQLIELSPIDIQQKLSELLALSQHYVDLKEGAILDYFTSGICWAKSKHFSVRQTSGFFTLLHILLNNVKEHHLSLVDNMKELKKMLTGIGVDAPLISGGLDFFNPEQATVITEYVFKSFFQHYKLYEFVFSHTQAEEIIGADLDVEVSKPAELPYPAPLDEAVTEEMYEDYILTPPPTPQPEVIPAEAVDPLRIQTNIFEELTVEDVREVVESVAQEMISDVQTDLAKKLRLKEADLLSRINKVHQIAET